MARRTRQSASLQAPGFTLKVHPEGRTRIALAMIADQREYSLRNNLKEISRLATEAGRLGCDLFATEEVALSLFCGEKGAVRVPGLEVRRVAAIARRYRMYIALGLVEKIGRGRQKHNSQVLIDRSGRIVGIYRKMQLTNGEIRGGTVPGERMQVFETDFGRIAFIICYDSQFVEVSRMAGLHGADLIMFPHVGGAVGDDLIGRSVAYHNCCWTATVGRNFNCVCDPRGITVASLREPGKLLVVDADLKRTMLSVNPALMFLSWRAHQLQERRPETYSDLLGPPVVVECPRWPLYTGNALQPGDNRLAFHLVNRSARRQRGWVRGEFPARRHILTDEHVTWFMNRRFGQKDWRPRPNRFRFDLKAGQRKRCEVRFSVPRGACGLEAVRICGRTAEGWNVLWERQLERYAEPPKLRVPRVPRGGTDAAAKGVRILLDTDWVGAPAGSRTELHLAHDGRSLLIHAVCRRYGPWRDELNRSPDSLSVLVVPQAEVDRMFLCSIHRTGQKASMRREGSHPVVGRFPRWTVSVRRGRPSWTVLMRLPFREFEENDARRARSWRFNIQRAATLPHDINRARYLGEVVMPRPRPNGRLPSIGVEWAPWNPHYSRLDNMARLGTLLFD